MRAIAHRGCLTQYPENTLRAFSESSSAVDMIEMDIRRCGSEELVVFHDDTLDRVTDATGRVDEASYDRLRSVSVDGSAEGVPRLSDVLEVVPSDVGLNLELKDEGIAADVLDHANSTDHDVLVSSFDATELAAARDAGDVPLAYLCLHDPDEAIETATALDCSCLHPSLELALETNVVARAHDRGLGVNVWTIETAAQLDTVRATGADGVVIDDCTLASSC